MREEAIAALERIALLLERRRDPGYRVRAFRTAADAVRGLTDEDFVRRGRTGAFRDLKGVGEKTERVIVDVVAGRTPSYLEHLEEEAEADQPQVDAATAALLAALRGDCHVHSDWSDGGSDIAEMAVAARDLGHEYIVLTDHSRSLTIAKGLSNERLERQLEVVAALNEQLAPFRILTGIEVDILEDGSLDQDDHLLERLDVVVASVHSKLRSEPEPMTRRMVRAMENPHADILGHCTGRIVVGRGRPESRFDHDAVLAAIADNDKALEINCRPERLDPPRPLLREALEAGCRFSVDTDAHAPGQLAWQPYGATRGAECGLTADRVVNSMGAADLVAWARSHSS